MQENALHQGEIYVKTSIYTVQLLLPEIQASAAAGKHSRKSRYRPLRSCETVPLLPIVREKHQIGALTYVQSANLS